MAGSHPEQGGASKQPDPQDEVLDGHVVEDRPPLRASRRLGVEYQESRYASPLPSPDDLERYKQLLPDAPERLLAAGEREQAHRHRIEDRLVSLDEAAMPRFYQGQKRGQLISLTLGSLYLAVMVVAILGGAELAGIVGAAAGIAAIIWATRRDPSGPAEPEPGQTAGDVVPPPRSEAPGGEQASGAPGGEPASAEPEGERS